MTIQLDRTLNWQSATGDDAVMLAELQPNIVKGHVREHLSALFLQFGDAGEAKTFLGGLVPLMKSAKTHLEETQAFSEVGTPGTTYVGVGLTSSGYATLGVPNAPGDQEFVDGMKSSSSRSALLDPPLSTWEEPYTEDVHAVVIIGDTTDASVSRTRLAVLALMPDTVSVVGEEIGLGQRNENGHGIEHFGYVDGRSQPLFLTSDVEAERDTQDGTDVWDAAFHLDQVLVADSAAPDPSVHFGSYFIFRKLEQNVARFKLAENDLADRLGLEGVDRHRAGAMLVGRFEDGTPLTSQGEDGAHQPLLNNFRYDSDIHGAKCPFHAHIRKTNPRGSGGFENPADERRHLMARRGQTYGQRSDVAFDDSVPVEARPTRGVGLLFMAFNADIGAQFAFTQRIWANNVGFPRVPAGTAAPGVDAVFGHGARPKQTYPDQWGGTDTQEVDAVAQAVTMKGGEYFFMPSLAFLRSLTP